MDAADIYAVGDRVLIRAWNWPAAMRRAVVKSIDGDAIEIQMQAVDLAGKPDNRTVETTVSGIMPDPDFVALDAAPVDSPVSAR